MQRKGLLDRFFGPPSAADEIWNEILVVVFKIRDVFGETISQLADQANDGQLLDVGVADVARDQYNALLDRLATLTAEYNREAAADGKSVALGRKDAADSLADYEEQLALIDQMLPLAAQFRTADGMYCGGLGYIFNQLETTRAEIEKRIAALAGATGKSLTPSERKAMSIDDYVGHGEHEALTYIEMGQTGRYNDDVEGLVEEMRRAVLGWFEEIQRDFDEPDALLAAQARLVEIADAAERQIRQDARSLFDRIGAPKSARLAHTGDPLAATQARIAAAKRDLDRRLTALEREPVAAE